MGCLLFASKDKGRLLRASSSCSNRAALTIFDGIASVSASVPMSRAADVSWLVIMWHFAWKANKPSSSVSLSSAIV